MNGASELTTTADDRAIRFRLVLPVTRLGVGVFSFDALEQLVGAPIADLLEPMMTGPVHRRPSAAGAGVDVYPLALLEGEGLAIPLGQFGEVGFRNDGGLVEVTVPARWGARLGTRLGSALARGPERLLAPDGASELAVCWVRLQVGMRASVPLGSLGELSLEARGRGG